VLIYDDPYVPAWSVDGMPIRRVEDLGNEIKAADLVILLQDHADYDLDLIARAGRLVLDTRGRLTGPNVTKLLSVDSATRQNPQEMKI
jgi:UDP-N-acetyl-D-glucosamine dehydrogenase